MGASPAFTMPLVTGAQPVHRWRRAQGRPPRPASPASPATPRVPSVPLRCCSSGDHGDASSGARYEPVERGILLAPLPSAAIGEERQWLAGAVTAWLDAEWCTPEPAPIHASIGERVAQIYVRQRMEGEDDLSGVLLAIGQELEAFDMSDAFVGPFNVANKVADLLLSERAGPRETVPEYKRDPRAPVWSEERARDVATRRRQQRDGADREPSARDPTAAPRPPSLADKFDRFMFLKQILDGSASSEVVSGALALVVGFEYDAASRTWSGANVKDDFFRAYGDCPSRDVLVDAAAVGHLSARIAEGDDDGARGEALNVVIEAMHGTELTKIMRNQGDADFARREVLAKFLHMFGGF
jgi:hypothetical protein